MRAGLGALGSRLGALGEKMKPLGEKMGIEQSLSSAPLATRPPSHRAARSSSTRSSRIGSCGRPAHAGRSQAQRASARARWTR